MSLQLRPKNINRQLAAEDKRFERITQPSSADISVIADAIRAGFAENFESESSAAGRWRPLSMRTRQERQEQGYHPTHPILVRSGSYRDSFLNRGSNHVEEIDITSEGFRLFVGSSDERVALLELGEGRVPARPVLELTSAQEARIGDRLEDWLP